MIFHVVLRFPLAVPNAVLVVGDLLLHVAPKLSTETHMLAHRFVNVSGITFLQFPYVMVSVSRSLRA